MAGNLRVIDMSYCTAKGAYYQRYNALLILKLTQLTLGLAVAAKVARINDPQWPQTRAILDLMRLNFLSVTEAPVVSPALTDATPHTKPNGR